MTDVSAAPRSRWIATALLASAAALVLIPTLFGRDPIYGFDTVQEKYFWRAWAYGRLASGEWPWWCAGLAGGFPLIAEPITQFWYPPVAVAHLLLPIGAALNLTWWLHLTWAALGMARLLRSRGTALGAATLGGLGYGLSGWMIGHVPMGGLPHLASCAWAPWLISAALRVLESPSRPRPDEVAIVSVTFSASLLAGHAQFTYGALLFLVLFALLGPRRRACPAPGSSGRRRSCPGWSGVIALLLAFGLGTALAAVMVVPYAELLAASNRGAALPGDFGDFGARLVPAQLLGMFAPRFFGGSGDVPYWGFPTREAVTPYFGVIPLAFALSPVPARARREAWALRLIAILGLLLAMGPATPVLSWLRTVAPLVDRARHPARWIQLTVLAGSWLAALGAQRLLEGVDRDGLRQLGRWRGPGAGGLAVVGLVALGTWSFFSVGPHAPGRYASLVRSRLEDSALPEHSALRAATASALQDAHGVSSADCWRAVAYCAVAMVLLALARIARRPGATAWVAVGLTLIDLVSQGRREIFPMDRAKLAWSADVTRVIASLGPAARVATTVPGAEFPFPAEFRDAHAILSRIGQADMHRPLLVGAATPQAGIPTTPARWLRLALGEGAYDFNDAALAPRSVLDLLAVDVLLTAPGQRPMGDAWERIHADERTWLWRNEGAEPRATLVHECLTTRDSEDALRAVRDPARALRPAVAVVTGECPFRADAVQRYARAREEVRWIQADDQHVALEAHTSARALLRLADAALPGWTATVDGDETPIYTVDYALRGVVVPAGIHRVDFRYRPTTFLVGIGISSASVVVVLLLWALPRRRHVCRSDALASA